jgi:tetratricopeptide (TPR) repeat protein
LRFHPKSANLACLSLFTSGALGAVPGAGSSRDPIDEQVTPSTRLGGERRWKMTPQSNKRNDNMLLAAVAACVVAGAVGLTLLVGLRTTSESPGETRAVARKPAARSAVLPVAQAVELPGEPVAEPVLLTGVTEPTAEGDAPSGEAVERIEVDPDADLLRVARTAWEAGHFARAAAYFEAEAKQRPQRAYTHYMLALSLWKSGELDRAHEAMERSATLNGRSIRTWINLARIQNDRADFSAALGAATRAREIEEDNPTALYQEGRALRNLGRIDESLAALERVVELRPDYGQAYNLVGLIQIDRERWDEALGALELASRHAPGVAYVQNNLGLALERKGLLDEALVAYRRALELDSGHEPAASNLARLVPPTDSGSAEAPVAVASVEESVDPQGQPDPQAAAVERSELDQETADPAGEPID